MTDTIKIDNLIENMKDLEVIEEPEQPVVKEKEDIDQSSMICRKNKLNNIKRK